MEEQNVVGSSSIRDRHPSIEATAEPDDAVMAIKVSDTDDLSRGDR